MCAGQLICCGFELLAQEKVEKYCLTEYSGNAACGFGNLKRFDNGFCEGCIFGKMMDYVGHDSRSGQRSSMRSRSESNCE